MNKESVSGLVTDLGIYRLIFDSFQDSALVLDRHLKVLSANRSFYSVFKTDPSLIIGYPFDQLGAGQWEIRSLSDRLKNFAENTINMKFEAECSFFNSSRKIMQIKICRIFSQENGEIIFLLLLEDITEQKRAEEVLQTSALRYHALLASVPDIIMEINGDKIYTWSNAAGLDFFGDDIIGKEAFFYDEDEPELHDEGQIFSGENRDAIYIEGWQKRRDGQRRLMAWWCRVLKNSEGNAIGALSTARDITEQKLAEAERAELINQLRDALSKVNQLSGMLPICSYCKKILDDKGYWNLIETYIRNHSEAEFSHGICPGCAKEFYPQYFID